MRKRTFISILLASLFIFHAGPAYANESFPVEEADSAVESFSIDPDELLADNESVISTPESVEESIGEIPTESDTESSVISAVNTDSDQSSPSEDISGEDSVVTETQEIELEQNLAGDSEDSETWNYTLLDDGTLEITGYNGSETHVTIPEDINGVSVSRIGFSAFYYSNILESLSIPSTVNEIRDKAFANCNNLKAVNIAEGVTTIGDSVFENCINLETISLPSSISSIGGWGHKGIFGSCSKLKTAGPIGGNYNITFGDKEFLPSGIFAGSLIESVVLPGSLMEIGEYAFYNTSLLKNIIIPNNVAILGRYAFSGSGLEKIEIPYGVDILSQGLISSCSSLKTVKLPDTITEIESACFSNCTALETIEIPYRVKALSSSLFNNCKNLKSVNLPDAITSIDRSCFEGCTALPKTMDFSNIPLWWIGDNAFKDCTSIVTIKLPNGLYSIGTSTFEGCSNLERVELGFGCGPIGEKAFADCKKLKSVVYRDFPYFLHGEDCYDGEVTNFDHCEEYSIANYAFANDTMLSEVEFRPGLTSIGIGAFNNCSSLNHIKIYGSEAGWSSVAIKAHNTPITNAKKVFQPISPAHLRISDRERIYSIKAKGSAASNEYIGPIVANPIPYSLDTSDLVFTFASSRPEIVTIPSVSSGVAYLYSASVGDCIITVKETTFNISEKVYIRIQFNDVSSQSKYYYKPVYWALNKGITSGTSKTNFSPDAKCTRGQVVTFLWRAAGSPEPKSKTNPFKDVKSDKYYYKAVLWAVENKITSGLSKTAFGPDAACTRSQVVTFLHRAKGKPASYASIGNFSDVSADKYYYDAVRWAVKNNVTSGTSATAFSPDSTCTRGQIVTFLSRAYN